MERTNEVAGRSTRSSQPHPRFRPTTPSWAFALSYSARRTAVSTSSRSRSGRSVGARSTPSSGGRPPQPGARRQVNEASPSLSAAAIPGLGTSGGFSMWLQDRSGRRTSRFLAKNLDAFHGGRKRSGRGGSINTVCAPRCRRSMRTSTATQVLKQGNQL